jgi:fibronectin-binding autotransporter adhesin
VPAAVLTISNTVAREFSGIIGNSYSSLALVKTGSGTQTLSGVNVYDGATTVAQGALVVNGALGGTAVAVANGAVLEGRGRIRGPVTVADGGHIAPGASVGTLAVGNLTLNNDSLLDFDLSAPHGTNDCIQVDGALLLDGVLQVRDAGGFRTGTYILMRFRSTVTNNGLRIGVMPYGAPASIAIDTQSRTVTLVVSSGAGATLQVR